jgi:molybdenum cofactor cytidylyltransferase
MGASLRAAVRALASETDGVFVFLGDMPRIPPGLAEALAQALTPGVDAVAPCYAGRRGPPVLFGRTCFPTLKSLAGDTGARELLAAIGKRLALVVTADPGALFDVDRPEDLA